MPHGIENIGLSLDDVWREPELNGKKCFRSFDRIRTGILTGLLALFVVALGFTGCTKKNEPTPDVTPTAAENPSPTPTVAPTATPTPAPTATPTPSPTPTPTPRVQDAFDATDDEGVYLKKPAFSGLAASDLYYVGGRLIFSNLPREEYEDMAVGVGDTVKKDVVYADLCSSPVQDEKSREYADPAPDEDDREDDEYGDPPVWDDYDDPYYDKGTLHLYSVDPVTWDMKEINLDSWNFYRTAITPIGNGTFALSDYKKNTLLIYDNMLELQKTLEIDTESNFRFSLDGSKLWYIKDSVLYCYDVQTGEETKPDYLGSQSASYFSDDSDSVISKIVSYEYKKGTYTYTNHYINTVTGEYLGTSDFYSRYIYSPDVSRAVLIKSGDTNKIEVYECSMDNLFPGEPAKDEETGEELPPAAEEVCRLDLQSSAETGNIIIDWDRDIIITDIFYNGIDGFIYEYNCYSMITGKLLSNNTINGFGYNNLYYTFDPDAGLYYLNYCDDDDNSNLFAWDYSADTLREYQDVFRKFTDIPQKVEDKRRELEEKYGFYIYIGTEVFANDFDYDLKIYKDYEDVYKQMDVIDEVLGIYPEGFFEQFKYGGIKTLSIYLCGGFEKRDDGSNTISDAIALACVFGYERALALDLNWSYCLKRTIVHEISHWIDGRIDSVGKLGGYADYEDDWLKLNPEDFTYKYSYVSGRTIWKYIYDEYGSNDNTYFIDSYSQTYPTEDRARLFEYLMFADESESSDYLAVPNLQDKLKFYFEAIRKCYDTSKWPEKTAWEEELDRRFAERESAGDTEGAESTENSEN
ncbi:MAG: hypothetical protein K6E85_13640 [Lachnospiraceae bacterium]|nr:hypothetical protein [Lachnospiraceae bacterium]